MKFKVIVHRYCEDNNSRLGFGLYESYVYEIKNGLFLVYDDENKKWEYVDPFDTMPEEIANEYSDRVSIVQPVFDDEVGE